MESKAKMGQLNVPNDNDNLCSCVFHDIEISLKESNNLISLIEEILERKMILLLGNILDRDEKDKQEEVLAKNPVEPSWSERVYNNQLKNVKKLIQIKENIEKI